MMTSNEWMQKAGELEAEVERLRAEKNFAQLKVAQTERHLRRIEEAAREFFETWDVGRRGAALRAALEEK